MNQSHQDEVPFEANTPARPTGGDTDREAPDDSDVPHAVLLLRKVVERRRFLLKVCVCGTALSLAAAFLIPKRYESTAMMAPPSGQSSLMSMMSSMGAAGQLGISMMHTPGGYYAKLATTESVENRLIDRYDLRKVYRASLYEKARKKLEARTAIAEDTKSGIISVRVTDREAWRAAALANGYVEEVNRSLTGLDTSSAHRERTFLEERLGQVKQELDVASHQLAEYSSSTATLDIKAQGMGLVESGTKLKGELIASEAELSSLEQVYSPDNVRVRAARAKVSVLRQNLEQLENEPAENRNQLPNMRQLPIRAVRYAELLRHVEIEEKLFAELTRQFELAKVEEVKELPVVQLINPALVPEKHTFPKRSLVVLLGLFFSFSLGLLWIIAVELWTATDARNPRMRILRAVLDSLRLHKTSQA